jgi:hypothetical protein
MIPVTRIITIAMAGVLCFLLIVPLAYRAHNFYLLIGMPILYVGYVIANIVLWRRMKQP